MKIFAKFIISCVWILPMLVLGGCSDKEPEKLSTMEQARVYYSEAKYQEAAATYKQAINEGEGIEAWNGLIDSLIAVDSSDKSELINAYEELLLTDNFTDDDYYVLADLYEEAGNYNGKRDLLEKHYILTSSEETLLLLGDIVCDVSNEKEELSAIIKSLRDDINGGDWEAAASLIIEENTFDVLFPKLDKGHRRYELNDGESNFKIEAGLDEQGVGYINCWSVEANDVKLLTYKGGAVLKYMAYSMSGEDIEGDFTLWSFNSIAGSVINDEGCFSKGVCQGEITTRASFGNAAGISQLLTDKAVMVMNEYKGSFNEDGTTAERQDKDNPQHIIYGYSEDEENVIYIETTDMDAKSFIFGYDVFDVPVLPNWSMIKE